MNKNMKELVNRFEAKGIHLWVDGGKIKYKAPKELMTPDVLAELKANKESLIEFLSTKSDDSDISIVIDRINRFEPFPLTDVQSAYLLGRSKTFEYGGVACHVYLEIRYAELETQKVRDIWNAITHKYDMLHAIINESGFQQVMKDVPELEIPEWDLLKNPEKAAEFENFRKEMGSRTYTVGKWPMFGLAVSRNNEGAILHFSIEFLLADWTSIWKLVAEFEAAYFDGAPVSGEEELSFRDYLIAEKKLKATPQYEKEKKYWMDRIANLPDAPELPKLSASEAKDAFGRKFLRIPADAWNRIKTRAKQYGLTPTVPILSCYADVLAKWSRNKRFCINMTVLNRLPLHEKVMDIVGDFTSLSLLEVDCGSKENFLARTRKINGQLFADLDNRLFSGVEVMREISRQSKKTGLTMPIVYTSAIGLADSGTPLRGEFSGGISQTPQTFIDCQVMDGAFGLQVNWDYREGVFPSGVLESMFEAFENRLLALATENEDWENIANIALPARDVAERKAANVTRKDWNVRMLQDDFIESVRRTPKKIAIDDGTTQFTFEELDARAKVVADQLITCGVKPQDCVPVLMEKSAWQLVSVFGILYAGAIYVPIAAAKAKGRAEKIVKKTGAKVALGISTDEVLLEGELITINVDTLSANNFAVDCSRFPKRTPDDIAYIIYTSGSTGEPKGVVITHKGAMNTIDDMNDRFHVTADDAVLGLSQLNFDLSVYDIFGVLACGGTVIYPTAQDYMNPEIWESLIHKNHITVWNTVPALMKMLLNFVESKNSAEPLPLKEVFLSGDWIPVDMPERIRKVAPSVDVICLGGATEASIWSNYHRYDPNDGLKILPYGRPLANQTMHILDNDLQPCPTMVAGQIALGGDGVALGYYLDAERTAAQFVTLPKTDEQVYLTGDMGRYLPGGEIEFLGREDTQVKIRGHRIELGEIENVLKDFPAIKEAVAIVSTDKREIYSAIVPENATNEAIIKAKQKFNEREKSVEKFMQACVSEINIDQIKAGYEAEETASTYTILLELQKMGLFQKDKPYTLEEIKAPIISKYHWLVTRWISFLQAEKLIKQQGNSYICHAEALEQQKEALWKKAYEVWNGEYITKDFLEYVKLNGEHLAEIAQGNVDPGKFLYPEEGDKYRYVDSLYVKNKIMVIAYKTLAEYLKKLLDQEPNRPIRILEIGAGTGSATRYLLPTLKGHKFEYYFTDYLKHFFPTAAEMFKEYPELVFKQLDMNEDFVKQGLKPNSFDIVFGGYVMDNAIDFSKTLEQIENVLVPGGHFMFLESYELSAWITITQALLMDVPTDDLERQKQFFEQLKMSRSKWAAKLEHGEKNVSLSSFPASDEQLDLLHVLFFVKQVKTDKQIIDEEKLKEHLDKYLLHYMHPGLIQEFDALPLSANGKIDRKNILKFFEESKAKSGSLNIAQLEESLICSLPIEKAAAILGNNKDNLIVAVEPRKKQDSQIKASEEVFAKFVNQVDQDTATKQTDFDWNKIETSYRSIEKASADSILLGLFKTDILVYGKDFTKSEFEKTLPEKFRFHAQEWINVLLENGYIAASENGFKILQETSAPHNEAKWHEAIQNLDNHIGTEAYVKYLKDNGIHFAEILEGTVDPEQFVYKNYIDNEEKSALQNWADIIQAQNNYKVINDYIVTSLKQIMASDSKKTWRILELGAGTGQITRQIFAYLKESGIPFIYNFTDKYTQFFPMAGEYTNKDSAMIFTQLDFNENFEAQGIAENSVDIVLCGGVMANSINLNHTLEQIKKTLVPGGFLFIEEVCSDCASVSVSQALMMDKPTDKIRENYMFLPKKNWLDLLRQKDKLRNATTFPLDDNKARMLGGYLYVKQFKYDREDVSESSVKPILNDICPEKNSSIQILDKLPTNTDGSIDKRALKHYANAFESSQSNEKSIESRLVEITVKALNIDSIGLDDNFYDFGADSLLMAQMATTIRNELASDKTFDAILKQLLDFPTITEVAQFLKNEVTEESGDSGELIQLQRIGKPKNNCARILLPTVLWNNEMYHEIIPLMEKQDEGEIFTFKLSNPQQFFDINPDEVASVLAKTFAEKIIEAQIEKVQIIGYSFSGKMSLELAERLENAGIEIADFVIVEGARLPFEIKQTNMKDFFFATLIGVDPQKVGFKFEDITFLMNRYIEETKKKIIDESDFEKIISQSPDAAAIRNFNALSASERFQKIKEYSGDFGKSMTDEAFTRIKNTFDQNFNVMVNYNPTPYFGDLRYFKADNSNSIFKNADKFLFQKWDDLCIGEIKYEQLKGDHFTAFTSKEYAIDLAEKLSIGNTQENA